MLISEDQIQELYEINDDPKRKEFLDDLFSFMQKRGKPINRLPIMAKSVLDLFELYNLVIARGGLVDVINKKLWQEIIKGLHLPSSITSAAFTLRTQYMKYLYPYECEKKNLSTPAELQAAIDGNRREGRRSSYGQYEAMHNQMQMPQMNRQSLASGLQQISPLALVTHAANNQQAQAAAAAVAAHHRLMTPPYGAAFVPHDFEQRMIECIKLMQAKKEQNGLSNGSSAMTLSPQRQHHQQQQRQRSQSPEVVPIEALNAFEMHRVAFWQMYNNNTSPAASDNTPPLIASGNNSKSIECVNESERSEALNRLNTPPNFNTVKREREQEPCPDINEQSDFVHQPPPIKRTAFPTSFYLAPSISGMSEAATTTNYKGIDQESDNELDNDDGKNNVAANSAHACMTERKLLENSLSRTDNSHGSSNSVHNDKSDDSAIENSPTASAVSAANGNISPVTTKDIHLPNQTFTHNNTSNPNTNVTNNELRNSVEPDQFEAINLLSGMQFHITRNGSNSNGEQELAVNLEVNGIKYSGVLVANTPNPLSSTAKWIEGKRSSKSSSKNDNNPLNDSKNTSCNYQTGGHNHISNSINNTNIEAIKHSTVTLTASDVEAPSDKSPSTNQSNATKANGS